jgi:hypothetical protein
LKRYVEKLSFWGFAVNARDAAAQLWCDWWLDGTKKLPSFPQEPKSATRSVQRRKEAFPCWTGAVIVNLGYDAVTAGALAAVVHDAAGRRKILEMLTGMLRHR